MAVCELLETAIRLVADHRGGSLRRSVNGRGVLGAAAKGLDALAVEGWEFPKPPTCVVGESDPDHENFRRLKQGPGTLNPISKGGAGGGAVRGIWLDFGRKNTSPVNGAGGITGCQNDSQAPRVVPVPRKIFTTRLIDFGTLNRAPSVTF